MTDQALKESSDLIHNLSFCVFDLETTGGNHKFDKIIEVGLVKVENLKVVDEMSFLIDPQIKIPEFIQKLTSIKPSDLTQSPIIEDVLDDILNFMGDSVLVAHNSSFDVPFFNSVLIRNKRGALKNKSLCTNLMTKYLIPEILNSNLNYMSKVFDISHSKAHRALEDAKATADLLVIYLNFFINKGISKVNQLYYPRNKFELDRRHLKDNISDSDFKVLLKSVKSPLLISFKGKNGTLEKIYISENPKNEIDYLLDLVQETEYTTLSLQLVGSFIDGFIKLNNQFNKMKEEDKKSIINRLYEIQLPKVRSNNQVLDAKMEIFGHSFVITPHLIPEQFVIYPFATLQYRGELIFRSASHQKKLVQYIVNQSRKIKEKKKTFCIIVKPLQHFYYHYLQKKLSGKDQQYLFIKKMKTDKMAKDFLKEHETFFVKNSQTNNYPKDHI